MARRAAAADKEAKDAARRSAAAEKQALAKVRLQELLRRDAESLTVFAPMPPASHRTHVACVVHPALGSGCPPTSPVVNLAGDKIADVTPSGPVLQASPGRVGSPPAPSSQAAPTPRRAFNIPRFVGNASPTAFPPAPPAAPPPPIIGELPAATTVLPSMLGLRRSSMGKFPEAITANSVKAGCMPPPKPAQKQLEMPQLRKVVRPVLSRAETPAEPEAEAKRPLPSQSRNAYTRMMSDSTLGAASPELRALLARRRLVSDGFECTQAHGLGPQIQRITTTVF